MTPTARDNWFYRRGVLERDGWAAVVDATIEGWHYTGLRVADLDGGQVGLVAEDVERIVVPLSGSFTVRYRSSNDSHDRVQELHGRPSVFAGPTDVLYLPITTSAEVTGRGRVAVAEAAARVEHPAAYLPVSTVPVELRGAGRSSRQVHNFGTPSVLAADRLIVCEVITPAENWSSYPPHKHDERVVGRESSLEEIYYFESAVSRGIRAPAEASPFGYFRTSSSPAGAIDTIAEVHTGDIALVPFGWHGPCVATPGYDLYYLNVMAGPEREWLITDHPGHAWIRDTWVTQEIDPRLPYLEPRTDTDEQIGDPS